MARVCLALGLSLGCAALASAQGFADAGAAQPQAVTPPADAAAGYAPQAAPASAAVESGDAADLGAEAKEAPRAPDTAPQLERTRQRAVAREAAQDTERALPPSPEPRFHFGESGTLVVSDSNQLWLNNSEWSGSLARSFSTGIVAAFDFFIGHGFSLGFYAQLSYANSRGYGADSSLVDTKSVLVSAGPRFGLAVPLGPRFSWFPRVTLGLHHGSEHLQIIEGTSFSTGSPTGAPSFVRNGPWIQLDLPLLLHLTPEFYLGFGPTFYYDFARATGGPDVGAQQTQLGLALEVGGVLFGSEGGTGLRETDESQARAVPEPRFGELHALVLSGESALSGTLSQRSGIDALSRGLTLGPACDWFVAEHVSFGGSIRYTISRSVSFNGPEPINSQAHGISIAPRIGVDVPLGISPSSLYSLYSRASFSLAGGGGEERSTSSRNAHSYTALAIDFEPLLLFHLARHFFVGLGPELYHELWRSVQPGSHQNRNTTIGISSIVGGWI